MLYRTAYYLLLTIFICSCSAAGSSNAYPTYDPFTPLNGSGTQIAPIQPGEFIQEFRTPLGPTPTRAAVSVTLAPRDTDPSFETPTPDAPHALPAPRESVDEYIVQPGDTLGSIAREYQVTLEALMQANALDESSILSVGVVLQIPPIN
ncbi:MAG TPA: LysM peptidoglycan-binding domain-containing protein, partial [Anaerolineales bacterium]|nr:LysM peptidoglycan-binding domain-containing protein [Anaerolineales bacterium]